MKQIKKNKKSIIKPIIITVIIAIASIAAGIMLFRAMALAGVFGDKVKNRIRCGSDQCYVNCMPSSLGDNERIKERCKEMVERGYTPVY